MPVHGASICYDDCGQGEIPILFIHGFPFNKSSWSGQIEYLKSEHRVIAYDIRGFGQSTPGSKELSISVLADDLIQFMNQLEIPKAIVCGISMGGYILLNAVCRYPEKFKAIVLCDTNCIADSDETKEKRKKTIDQIKNGKVDEFATSFVEKVFSPNTAETNLEARTAIKNSILTTAHETLVGGLTALKNRDAICTSLNQLAIPALILCGSEDVVTPPAQSEYLHQKIIGSEFQLIKNAGHLPNVEQPIPFNTLLSSFIAQVLQKGE